ncbi:PEP-CTERM sorting domain-containing protein [Piscinibacter sp. XHJ-5]|uniref:PEP-CTERM sorting domain-containing protein n=1 Tax=Piscinibacter sp. XHJ-5 TaxID=3037797 RepID=UPI002452B6D5|nr:PEP-CTERM sorting domain-containing protein [Piscinibacter sp. XHJ-5]
MKLRTSPLRRVLVGAALAGAAALAQAETGSFSCINGTSADCGLAESTLSWAWNGLDFTIANNGSGYVSEVYFSFSTDELSANFLSGVGDVHFVQGASPGSLPGGGGVGFVTDQAFDSDGQGQPTHGINFGESATFRILSSLEQAVDVGDFLAGVHVRSLVTAGASLVSTSGTVVTPVPEPETYAMMLLGFGIVAWGSRRRA